MRKLTAAFLCLTSAAVGAAGMLVFLDARHGYAMKQAVELAERDFPETGSPPERPGGEELARARQACASLSGATGLSLSDLGNVSHLVQTRPNRAVDGEALAESFTYLDRLRITFAGLSRRDFNLARTSVRHDPVSEQQWRRATEPLSETLLNCGYIAADERLRAQ